MRLRGWGATQLKGKLGKTVEGLACCVRKLWLSSVVRVEKTEGKMARKQVASKKIRSTLGIECPI